MNKQRFPQWISHRGYYKHQVENTVGAFDEAVNLGFDRLETDLRITKDGHIVLCHDKSLARVGGPDADVSTLTRAELQNVRLRFHTRVMFFEDFCDRYAANDWIFDIKPEDAEKTIEALKEWTEYNGAHDLLTKQAWFLFWDRAHEAQLKKFLPDAKVLADEKMCWRAGISLYFGLPFLGGIKKGKIYSVIPKFAGRTLFKKKIVAKLQKYGAKALAYLPANEKEMEQAVAAGFDYVLTELPPIRPRRIFTPSHRSGGPSHGGPGRGPSNRHSGGSRRHPQRDSSHGRGGHSSSSRDNRKPSHTRGRKEYRR